MARHRTKWDVAVQIERRRSSGIVSPRSCAADGCALCAAGMADLVARKSHDRRNASTPTDGGAARAIALRGLVRVGTRAPAPDTMWLSFLDRAMSDWRHCPCPVLRCSGRSAGGRPVAEASAGAFHTGLPQG